MSTISVDVAVIDYRLNNLSSISRGLEEAGAARVRVVRTPEEVAAASHLVLPGVGHFDAAMRILESGGWPDALRRLAGEGRSILGICLGMQLLGSKSEEADQYSGIGLLGGAAERLPEEPGVRVPHVGWNLVSGVRDSPLMDGIPAEDFYFVHSYAMSPDLHSTVAVTPHGHRSFASVVEEGTVGGVQFHPEKSSRAGTQLLRNFLARGRRAC